MRRILIVAVASSLATGAVIAATGIAQSGGGDDNRPPPTMAQALKQHQQQRDARLARIAGRLDISTDKLKGAIEKVRTNELDEAVRSGRLTDAQRDALLACKSDPLKCDRSNLPAPRFFRREAPPPRDGQGQRREFRRHFRQHHQQFLNDLAKELGIDASKVRAAFEAERPRGPRGRHGGPMGGPPGPPPGGAAPGGFGGPGPGEVEPAAAPA
jgi:hypothetical protein